MEYFSGSQMCIIFHVPYQHYFSIKSCRHLSFSEFFLQLRETRNIQCKYMKYITIYSYEIN